MQRFFLGWMMWTALYVSGLVNATELKVNTLAVSSVATVVEEIPVPHIALLLPIKSPAFRAAAEAVQQGFVAANTVGKPSLPVRVYGCADEGKEIAALYAQALAKGARAVVGPLTRNGVNVLAAQPNINVPTLTLNTLDGSPDAPIYGFGMAAEAEARLVAQLAFDNGLRHAIVISSTSPFDLRMQFAFEEAWSVLGGTIKQELEFHGDPTQLGKLMVEPDTLIFLAGNAQYARVIRPYLPKKLPIYATSQIFINNNPTNFELNGIHFVDMPWLVQADDPAMQVYPHATPAMPIDLERLYALGIDAYRLIQLLLQSSMEDALPLNGVSGEIQLNAHQFQRMAIPATFVQGRVQSPNAPIATTQPPMFPGQPINKP